MFNFVTLCVRLEDFIHANMNLPRVQQYQHNNCRYPGKCTWTG